MFYTIEAVLRGRFCLSHAQIPFMSPDGLEKNKFMEWRWVVIFRVPCIRHVSLLTGILPSFPLCLAPPSLRQECEIDLARIKRSKTLSFFSLGNTTYWLEQR